MNPEKPPVTEKSSPEHPWPVRTVARKIFDWINRLGEEAEPQPDVELHSLTGLAENLDSLVPA